MAEYIITSGDYTYTGTYAANTNAGSWYTNQYYYGTSALKGTHKAEVSLTVATGYYDVYVWHPGNSLSEEWAPRNHAQFKDGSSAYTQDLYVTYNIARGKGRTFSTGWSYNGTQYWRKQVIGLECLTGTLNLVIEPDHRNAFNHGTPKWMVPVLGLCSTESSVVEVSEQDPTYTPTSNKSKPHPLSTN